MFLKIKLNTNLTALRKEHEHVTSMLTLVKQEKDCIY